MKRVLAILWLVALGCSLSFSQAPSIVKVRVFDYRNGRPVKGWKVGLLSGSSWMIATTTKTGEAFLRISDPATQTLTIDPVARSWSQWSCTQTLDFQTSDVLQFGATGSLLNHPLCRSHLLPTAPANPAEIIIYVRRLNPWLTCRRFLWEVFYG